MEYASVEEKFECAQKLFGCGVCEGECACVSGHC